MRLTLRTLLAFRDGLLGVDDAQVIGAKIGASQFASQLLHRLDEVGDDCAHTDAAHALDPNTLACYLDNSLPPEQIPALEKSFLDSDAQLAELAACHVILSQVLDHRMRVEKQRRERMYRLLAAHVAAPVAVAHAQSEMEFESDAELDDCSVVPSDDDILNWVDSDAESNSRGYRFVTEGAMDLSSGTAVLTAPPEADTASQSAAVAVAAVSRNHHPAKHRRTESSAPAAATSWYPTHWYSNLLGAAVARPVLSLTVLAGLFGAAVCVPVFGGFSAPPPQAIKLAAHAYGLPEADGEPCTRLDGRIVCRVQEADFADAGAIVIAWPAGVPRLAKFTTTRVFSELTTVPPKFTSMQLYVGQTNELGDYLLRLKPGDEYFVLVLSSSVRRAGGINSADREFLDARFEDPEKLIGARGYHLARCKVAKGAIRHDWQFGKKSE